MTLGLLGVFGCVPAFDNNFCRGLKTDQGTSASLRVKGLRPVDKYYARHLFTFRDQESSRFDIRNKPFTFSIVAAWKKRWNGEIERTLKMAIQVLDGNERFKGESDRAVELTALTGTEHGEEASLWRE